MNENVKTVYNKNPASQQMSSSSEDFSSASAESSSDSGNTEKISTPPSIKQRKNNKNNMSTPSQPSSSIKRPREPQEKQGTNPSSKKSKKPAQEDNKGKATAVPDFSNSTKKNVPIWNAKDEDAFLKRLVACCERGKGLPKNMGGFYESVKKDLDGDYSHGQLYNKLRGLKRRFSVAREKIEDKSFVGFKNAHEETVYGLSEQVWGNRQDDKGGNARAEEKEEVVVVDPEGEREEVKRNRDGVVDMALKKQEGEEDEDEDESDDEEKGEWHDQGEKNDNVNLAQRDTLKKMKTKEGTPHIAESVRNRVSGTGTSEEKVGEEKVFSEHNVGEEKDSSEDEERDNSTQHLSNDVSKERRRVGTAGHYDAGENSRRHVAEGLSDGRKVAAAGHHDARGNLIPNDGCGMPHGKIATTNSPNNDENVVHHVSNDMVNVTSCAVCKENLSIFKSQLLDILDESKYEIVNMVKKELRGSSNTARTSGIDFSMINEFSSGRELPALSDTEVEMLDQKRQMQQLIEMEAASKRLALLQEEYQLRLDKLRVK